LPNTTQRRCKRLKSTRKVACSIYKNAWPAGGERGPHQPASGAGDASGGKLPRLRRASATVLARAFRCASARHVHILPRCQAIRVSRGSRPSRLLSDYLESFVCGASIVPVASLISALTVSTSSAASFGRGGALSAIQLKLILTCFSSSSVIAAIVRSALRAPLLVLD
jgi:hypothetical protein